MAGKTDVIFLGAGASVGAGFPDNKTLANYIIHGFDELCADPDIQGRWHPLAQKLRKTNFLSVDAFCELTKDDDEVLLMKRIARLALIQYPWTKYGQHWKSTANPYRGFVESLFLPSTFTLDPSYAVVNFNYDGMLAKLLVDAVKARRIQNGQPEETDERTLAAIGGGYVHDYKSRKAKQDSLNADVQHQSFIHFMPHGTITVVKRSKELVTYEQMIYDDELSSRLDRFWPMVWADTPMIDFPWEDDSKASPSHRFQLNIINEAIRQAKRIHFIGLQGHPLMSRTLKRAFMNLEKNDFQRKQWFIATKEKDFERVFWRLCDCFLPDVFKRDTPWRLKLKVMNSGDFDNWVYESPHHPTRISD